MEHPALSLRTARVSKEVFTVDDIIKWRKEEAEQKGELGFGLGFPDMNEIAEMFDFDMTDDDPWPYGVDDRASLVKYAEEQHEMQRLLYRQGRKRQRLMDSMKPLVAETTYVDQKLEALRGKGGKRPRNLREKVVELTNLENPRPPPNYVPVWISVKPDDKLDQMIQVSSPYHSLPFLD